MAANWKMNKTVPETVDFLSAFIPEVRDVSDVDIVIAPPFTSLAAAAEKLKGTDILLAAQDVYFEEKGAYTGEVSPAMLKDMGCAYVIVGHSERRQYFHETDGTVNKKIKAARKNGLGVIFCIGETLDEREDGTTFEVLEREVRSGLDGVSPEKIVVAYEPIWAIGTGKTASPAQAQEAHAFVREKLKSVYGDKSDELCILYGGSVTPDNVDALMACDDVDGALVGGASLKPDSFGRIVKFKKKQ